MMRSRSGTAVDADGRVVGVSWVQDCGPSRTRSHTHRVGHGPVGADVRRVLTEDTPAQIIQAPASQAFYGGINNGLWGSVACPACRTMMVGHAADSGRVVFGCCGVLHVRDRVGAPVARVAA